MDYRSNYSSRCSVARLLILVLVVLLTPGKPAGARSWGFRGLDSSVHQSSLQKRRELLPVVAETTSKPNVVRRSLAGVPTPNCTASYSYYNNLVTHGPFGLGRVGNSFDDAALSQGGTNPITRIAWRTAGGLTSLEVTYQRGGTTPARGGGAGAASAFSFAAGEFIVHALVAHRGIVNGILFTTSLGRQVAIGQVPAKVSPFIYKTESPSACSGSMVKPRMVLVSMKGVANAKGAIEQLSLVWGLAPLPACPALAAASVLGNFGMSPWGRPAYFPDQNAKWIWHTPGSSKPSWAPLPTFVREFNANAAQVDAWLHLVVDDFAEVFLNGEFVGNFSGGFVGYTFPHPYEGRPLRLKPRFGLNTLAIRAANLGGPAGLAASLVSAYNNRSVIVRTDESWSYYLNPAANVLGPFNMTPWSWYGQNFGPGLFPNTTNATWISNKAHADTDTTSTAPASYYPITFSRVFLTYADTRALLHIMVDDTADVYLNGRLVGAVSEGWRAGTYLGRPLAMTLRGGFGNFITIRIRNTGSGPTGLAAVLLADDANSTVLLTTDATWAVAIEACLPAALVAAS